MMKPGTMHLLFFLVLSIQFSCNSKHQGCTDPHANNFDPSAIDDDGSCLYDTIFVSPGWTIELSEKLSETSGLLFWNEKLWTMNDDSDTRLYSLDTATGSVSNEVLLRGVDNRDWEDLAQDEDYIYVGDIGNNLGNRTDLHLLRIEKHKLLLGNPGIDTIWFSFSDQNNFESPGAQQTEFDCEAFIISSDSIFLFTKNWISGFTTKYALPKVPGEYVAQRRDSYNTMGQVTGATFLEQGKVLALCGYSGQVQPFLYIFYNYPDHDFFSGTSRRVNISLPFHQVEGVATRDGVRYFLSSEANTLPFGGDIPAKLFLLDLSELLSESG